MRLAVVAAGFTPGEADQLRRAMGAWRRPGHHRPVPQEADRRHDEQRPDRTNLPSSVFQQIRGFGEYGFPESHAASFALLVYVSAWLKCYYPAAFAAVDHQQPADGLLCPLAAHPRRREPTACGCCRSM